MAQVAQGRPNEVLITPQNQLQVVQQWGQALTELTNAQKVSLTPVEKEFGISIITNLTDRCIKSGIRANELNMTNFLEQVKHCSKLQLSINEQELFLDIRNDKDTGLKTVKISKQYQGCQKLVRRYCTKKIVRFKDGIVCKGDTFETVEDFDLGLTKIVKHIANPNIDRNNLYNIEKAYAIAYIEEFGKLVPYTCIIDKNRIMRAKNAATTDKVWTSDTQRMVLKTCYWCLWAMLKPYIELPIGLQESFKATEDEMEWDKDSTPPSPVEINPNTVYDIEGETNEPDVVVEDAVVSEPIQVEPVAQEKPTKEKEEVIPAEETLAELNKQETDPAIQIILYKNYLNNKTQYSMENYADGRKAYQITADGKKTIRVRVKE